MTVLDDLLKVTGIDDFDGSQTSLRAMADAIEDLTDTDWDGLTDEAQEWYNQTADAMNEGVNLPPIPGMKVEKGRKRTAKSKDTEKKSVQAKSSAKVEKGNDVIENSVINEADVEKGMVVTITTKRDEVLEGKVIKLSSSFITLEIDTVPKRIGRSRVAEVVLQGGEGLTQDDAAGDEAGDETPANQEASPESDVKSEQVDNTGESLTPFDQPIPTSDFTTETIRRLENHLNASASLLAVLKSEHGID